MGVGQLIAARRLARGWSQTKLAAEMGGTTSQRQISRLEGYDRKLPRAWTIAALQRTLGITEEEIYRAAGVLPPQSAPAPARAPVPAVFQDAFSELDFLADAEIIAYVESKPGAQFRAQMARQKDRRTPESYATLCRAIMRAWTSNAQLAIDASLLNSER